MLACFRVSLNDEMLTAIIFTILILILLGYVGWKSQHSGVSSHASSEQLISNQASDTPRSVSSSSDQTLMNKEPQVKLTERAIGVISPTRIVTVAQQPAVLGGEPQLTRRVASEG